MKASYILSALALAATSTSTPMPEVEASGKHYCSVDLKGGHYVADKQLTANVIAGFNARYTKYSTDSWSQYVLGQCQNTKGCTAALGFAGNNSGSTGGMFWFGYTYSGGPVTIGNFTKYRGAEDATAWTASNSKCSSAPSWGTGPGVNE